MLHLDLESSCQSSQGYHSDEVWSELSWLLKADTEAAAR